MQLNCESIADSSNGVIVFPGHTDPYSVKQLCAQRHIEKTYIYAKSKDTVFNKSQSHGTYNYVYFFMFRFTNSEKFDPNILMIEKNNYPSVWDDFVCLWCIEDPNMNIYQIMYTFTSVPRNTKCWGYFTWKFLLCHKWIIGIFHETEIIGRQTLIFLCF